MCFPYIFTINHITLHIFFTKKVLAQRMVGGGGGNNTCYPTCQNIGEEGYIFNLTGLQPPRGALVMRSRPISVANICTMKKGTMPGIVCTYQLALTSVYGVRGLSVDHLPSRR